MTIKVSLNVNAKPPVAPVSVNPTKENVNRGNQRITWVRDANQPAFTFDNVAFPPNAPFSAPTKTGNGTEMTVTENNTATADYPYTLTVNLNGTIYSTAPSTKKGVGNGTPIIHNN
jgi:hypothetical protein